MRLFLLLVIFGSSTSTNIVLYLANIASEQSNLELKQSLKALDSVFLSRQSEKYPIVIAYDKQDRHFLTTELKANLTTQAPGITFTSISRFRHVSWPFSMYTDVYHEENPYYTRLGYRHMCKFWSFSLFEQPFMRNVTGYLRLDTDTFLMDMPINPFNLLKKEETIGYLSSIVFKESPILAKGLWETFLRFAHEEGIHPFGLTPLSISEKDLYTTEDIRQMPIRDAIDVLYRRGYNLNYFYNNWEVSRVDLWTSAIYQRLAKHIEKAGGIIIRRWGDAPIRTLALHLLHPGGFRQYRGLEIHHKIHIRTQGSEL